MNLDHLHSLREQHNLPRGFIHSGRTQLDIVKSCGLLPNSKLLDIGCGWLRGGVWFIDYLNQGNYCGIEPWDERLQFGMEKTLWSGLKKEKNPRFDSNAEWDFSVFDEKFDFFVACSIWTHCGKESIEKMLQSIVQNSRENAVLVTSYWRANDEHEDYRGSKWIGKNKDDNQDVNKIYHDLELLSDLCNRCGFDVIDLFPAKDYSWLKLTKRNTG